MRRLGQKRIAQQCLRSVLHMSRRLHPVVDCNLPCTEIWFFVVCCVTKPFPWPILFAYCCSVRSFPGIRPPACRSYFTLSFFFFFLLLLLFLVHFYVCACRRSVPSSRRPPTRVPLVPHFFLGLRLSAISVCHILVYCFIFVFSFFFRSFVSRRPPTSVPVAPVAPGRGSASVSTRRRRTSTSSWSRYALYMYIYIYV